jgi:hypothetical protein
MLRIPNGQSRAKEMSWRKHIVKAAPSLPVPEPGEIDIAATVTVLVTSEDPAHPIEHVFDHQRGPGGSRWVAAEPGEQMLILVFDTPQTLHQIIVEVGVRTTMLQKLSLTCYTHNLRQQYPRQAIVLINVLF